ncbi:hypothetical protein XELAEV_18047370mg [Xenopus laevis]|uniref:Uncharacterized protein n=1 Tax=Xenopus laevis TaxID=8355 RepID=A0A974BVF5_XENLA|nr:hypothetical protein XELAEV_18047370mg [Xenopus laevis]
MFNCTSWISCLNLKFVITASTLIKNTNFFFKFIIVFGLPCLLPMTNNAAFQVIASQKDNKAKPSVIRTHGCKNIEAGKLCNTKEESFQCFHSCGNLNDLQSSTRQIGDNQGGEIDRRTMDRHPVDVSEEERKQRIGKSFLNKDFVY